MSARFPDGPQSGDGTEYGTGGQPGDTPSAQIATQPGAQGPFPPFDPAYGDGANGAPSQQGPGQPKKRTGLIVGIVVGVVVALIAAGVGAFLLMRGDDSTQAEDMTSLTSQSAGITVSVPSTWITGDGSAPDPSGIVEYTEGFDAYAHDADESRQVRIAKDPFPYVPNGAMARMVTESLNTVGVTSCRNIDTPNGTATVAYFMSYSSTVSYGSIAFIPTTSGSAATVLIVAPTEADATALTKSIAASAH